ncbi:MAG: cytochrome c peroxidase [Gemmatimonadota bacterium]
MVAVLALIGRRIVSEHRVKPPLAGTMPVYPASPARESFDLGLDSLGQRLETLEREISAGRQSSSRTAFLEARTAYKRVESLLEWYAPALASAMNGPLPEESEDRPAARLGAPAGFQILEEGLFPGGMSPGRDSIGATIRSMRESVAGFRALTRYLAVPDTSVLEAFRAELARITALGMAGFDVELTGNSVPEAAAAIDGMRTIETAMSRHGADARIEDSWHRLDQALASAVAYLRRNPRFETIDRLGFIVDCANPAARAVAAVRREMGVHSPRLKRLWRPEAATMFDGGAFDASAYAPDFSPPPTPRLIELGRRLFFEPRLSSTGDRTCASCHHPNQAFAEPRQRSAGLTGSTGVLRNAPTLLNSALAPALFADSRGASLEAQAELVLASPAEMGAGAEAAAGRLHADPRYRRDFAEALETRADGSINGRDVRIALAAYVRTLVGLDAPFDRAVRGDSTAMSSEASRGFNLFMGKGRCATCHFLPLFNGTAPPDFVRSEMEIIGVPATSAGMRPHLDTDPGRAAIDREATHTGAFKVPTLRNVALTAPYMHNGVFSSLREVIDFYNRGGGSGMGLRVPGQTLSARPLHLTRRDRNDLIAFLRALTDTSSRNEAPMN